MQEGAEPLPRCGLCGMHMSSGRRIKHRRTQICDNSNQIRWRRQNLDIANRCAEANFIIMGEEGAESIEGVDIFKYFGRPLDRSDDDWPEVLRDIRKAWQVWGWLGKLMQREGADQFVS